MAAITRLSTRGVNLLTQDNILSALNESYKTQIQLSSGKRSSYTEISDKAFQLISLENAFAKQTQFKENSEGTLESLRQVENSLRELSDFLSRFQTLLVSGTNIDNAADIPLAEEAEHGLGILTNVLNIQSHDGQYLFAGSRTNVPPVDLSQLGAFTPGTVDKNYYQGDDVTLKVRADSNFDLQYGIKADNDIFADIVLALRTVQDAPTSTDALNDALNLIKNAVDGTADLLGNVGADQATLEDLITSHEDFLEFTQIRITNIESVDIVETTVKLTQLQTSLEGSFAAIARISDLTILNYLT